MRNTMFAALLLIGTNGLASADPTSRDTMGSDELGKLLKQMGHEPRLLSPNVWQVSIGRDGWTVHIMVSLAPESERIWLESKFAPIPQPEIVPSSIWFKLLEENERISPAHFTFDKSDKRLHLYKAFDLTAISAARLKKELDGFDTVVRKTQHVWRSENFSAAEIIPVFPRSIKEASKDISPLEGNWRIVRVEANGESIAGDKLANSKPRFTIAGDSAQIKSGPTPGRSVSVKLDPQQRPRTIDFIDDKGNVEQGIYIVEAGLLTICVAGAGEDRPRQFITTARDRTWLLVLKKEE